MLASDLLTAKILLCMVMGLVFYVVDFVEQLITIKGS